MKNLSYRLAALCLAAAPLTASAQLYEVDLSKYKDYAPVTRTDNSLLVPRKVVSTNGVTATRPDHVNNAETMYFPPVFNQAGGSCGSASRICYMFTHELNSYRNLDGKKAENYYPSHFVWLLTNGNSGKDEFVTKVGVPSAALYGGQTYSSLFGNQDCASNNFGWMQGYDKWYAAMQNRMEAPCHFPLDVSTKAGREAVKNWLWNHNGDTDFHSGGIAGIGVASALTAGMIPSTAANIAAKVDGKNYVKKWGTTVDHALTIVGYDDRIEFDLDGNGVAGETSKDEVGAWIIVNSWGSGWMNNGFIYCPYAYGGAWFTSDGKLGSTAWWAPEIYKVRKNYTPKRTIKLEMDYTRRSELFLCAGVSTDLSATEPDVTVPFEHFKFAGDGNYGNTNPAPAIPMLGYWADGKLHHEPMEFGYDLTDLTAPYGDQPLKYFFIVQTKSWAIGSGHIYKASIIDYEQGLETPFALGSGVEIKNAGKQTVISVVIQGEVYNAPQNLSATGTTLAWSAPVRCAHTLTGYKVYKGTSLLATLSASQRTYDFGDAAGNVFAVTALYGDKESPRTTVTVPAATSVNKVMNFNQSGFTIPGVFNSRYDKATIEFWLRPTTLSNWNQAAGPGWGQFMMHANANGTFTAGWDTSNRVNTAANTLKTNTWKHIAVVVNGNTFTVYVNGSQAGTITSDSYSGIGGFGDLCFAQPGAATSNAMNGRMEEVRIWRTARTAAQIQADMYKEYGEAGLPDDLIAYFKGDMITENGETKYRNALGKNHGILHDSKATNVSSTQPAIQASTDLSSLVINVPAEGVKAGVPAAFSATCSDGAHTLKWTAAGAGASNLIATRPTLIFTSSGQQTVTLTALDKNGTEKSVSRTITVGTAPAPDASFTPSTETAQAGTPISLIVDNPVEGYLYNWSMPGAKEETSTRVNTPVTYLKHGTYTVTLRVTAADGRTATSSRTISISEVPPEAAMLISPAVIVKGETAQLTDQSKNAPYRWRWTLSNGTNQYIMTTQNGVIAPTQPGVYKASLEAANGSGTSKAEQERALIVCNEDSENGLYFSGNAKVTAAKIPTVAGTSQFTIDWWMQAGTVDKTCNGIGDAASTLLLTTTAGGGMEVSINGTSAKTTYNDFIIPGQWHHYAITLNGYEVAFYRDGEKCYSKYLWNTSLPTLSKFCIGTGGAPMNGQIDEFRVWTQALSQEQLRTYANGTIKDIAAAQSNLGLRLYYQFNQTGGNVTDATSNGNIGTRSGFGPDGDAWGQSKGVFCLNFGERTTQDVTANYLKNYSAPFSHTSTQTNTTVSNRFYAITDWKQENATVSGGVTTGVHVDTKKDDLMTMTTIWDGFSTLANHKVWQKVKLPAGHYLFSANYHTKWEGQPGRSYLAVAQGDGLPDTQDLQADALAYTQMQERTTSVKSNSVDFALADETEVSLGLVVNMSEKICLAINSFTLSRYDGDTVTDGTISTDLETLPAASLPQAAESRRTGIYDLSGRRIAEPAEPGIYIMNGKKVIVK